MQRFMVSIDRKNTYIAAGTAEEALRIFLSGVYPNENITITQVRYPTESNAVIQAETGEAYFFKCDDGKPRRKKTHNREPKNYVVTMYRTVSVPVLVQGYSTNDARQRAEALSNYLPILDKGTYVEGSITSGNVHLYDEDEYVEVAVDINNNIHESLSQSGDWT